MIWPRIDEVIEFASVELFDIDRRATALRTGVAELFGALVAGSHTMLMVRAVAENAGTTALIEVLKQFEQLSPSPDAGTRSELLRVTLAARDALDTLIRDGASDTHVMALAHARELLDRLSRAVRSIGAVGDEAKAGPIRLRAYLDWRTASRNGLRAMIAMGLGSLFWIVTAWPSGGSMLAMLGVICGLLATNPSAGAASVDFAKGVVLSTLCAFHLHVRDTDPCRRFSVAGAFDPAGRGGRRLCQHQAAFDACRGSVDDFLSAIGGPHQSYPLRYRCILQYRVRLYLWGDLRGFRLPDHSAA